MLFKRNLYLLIFSVSYCLFAEAQVVVTGSTGANGTYTSLTQASGAFAAINSAGSQSGNTILITITSDVSTENGANSLNAGTWTSLMILPEGERILSGSVALPLINLNGADNVIIDGLNVDSNSLTISNVSTTATSGTSTIRFIGDASNNTIMNCTISGSGTGAGTGTLLFSTGTSTGNDGNVIANNTINQAGTNLPTNAIYSLGTSNSIDNSSILLSENNIQDYFNPGIASNGVFISGFSSEWTITDNRFFQTATRTSTAGSVHRAINIVSAAGVNYSILTNTIGYSSSIATGVTTYAGAFANRFLAIEINVGTAEESNIQGNIIQAINLSHNTTASGTAPGIFSGISVLGGAVNIGTTEGNFIGDTTGIGSITISSGITGNYISGIYCTSVSSVSVQNNKIGSVKIDGGAAIGYTFHAINTAGTNGNFNISNNTIGSVGTPHSISVGTNGTTTSGVCSFNGITNSSTGNTSITDNVLSHCSVFGTGASLFNGILNSGSSGTLDILDNAIISCNNSGTGAMIGISNSAGCAVANIQSNILRNHTRTALTGGITGIQNTGAVTSSLNIDNNQLGNSEGGFINFTVANSSSLIGINNTGGASGCELSIQFNDILGISHSIAGTSAHTYILNSATTLSQNISNNTFTNLDVNTTGSIIFISNNVVVSSSGTQNINDNSIAGTFTRSSGSPSGSLTFFTSNASSVSGAIINNIHNDFSNITISGASTISGWLNTDAGNGTKTIENNIFSNWSGGTGSIVALNINLSNATNAVTNNSIRRINSSGNITAITTGAGNDVIYSNVIDSLISTGTTSSIVNGIAVTGGTTKNIYLNTIKDLFGDVLTTGSVNGIIVSGGNTINLYQNTIFNFQGNNLTTGAVNGIAISGGSNVAVYKNKIYELSSSSSLLTGVINGIIVSGSLASQTSTIYNNMIGDLRVTQASGNDLIRGLSLTSTGNNSSLLVYYNTIFLQASSSGTNFGTSGIYHSASSTSTTAALILRNNIITNTSTSKGTGLTVAYRRSSTALANYGLASDNNLFYAGAPASSRLIFYNGTNSDQTLADYQLRVGSGIDSSSVTEDLVSGPTFLSTTGSSVNFLHLDIAFASLTRRGGAPISGFLTDFDGDIRNITTPDIGADEYDGVQSTPLSGTYNVGVGETFTSLTNALGLFSKINSVGLSGNVIVNITSDITEDGSNALYQWRESGTGNYTLTLNPDTSLSRVLSGNVIGGLYRMIGADRVIIDGSFGGSGKYLTFRNTNNASTSTFQFVSDAIKNTISNCIIEGSNTSATSGTIFFSTGLVTGNDSMIISNNTISSSGSSLPVNGIYSAGSSTATDNSAISIEGNSIQDYFNPSISSSGILIASNSSSWKITGNKFFQSASRTTSANTTHRSIKIITPSGVSYLVNENIIGYANSNSTGTTIYNGSFTNIFIGIELTVGTSTASSIQGNSISGISISTITASGVPGIFSGISILAGNVNIGTSIGNVIGASTGNSSISVTSTKTLGIITGIYATTANNVSIQNNTIGSISTEGGASIGYNFNGIYTAGTLGNYTISSNTIGSSSTFNSISVGKSGVTTTGICTFNGIRNVATGTINISENTIQNCSAFGTGNSIFYGIYNSAGSGSLSITGNNIISGTSTGTSSSTAGPFFCILNTAAVTTLNINTNNIYDHKRTIATLFTGISNQGAVTGNININGNQLGIDTIPIITYSSSNNRAFTGISNSAGTSACAVSIQSNDIRGIIHSVVSTTPHTYIVNSAGTLSQNISSNTFTDIRVNTTGSITFISDNVVMPANGVQTVSNNSIHGSFTRLASSGAITLFTSTSSTAAANVTVIHNGNDFSNIVITGSASISGWVNTDAGTGSVNKTIQNNTFSNWTGGTGSITAMNVNIRSFNNSTNNNTISEITSSGSVIGISTGVTSGLGNDNIHSNTINSLVSNGASSSRVTGIIVLSTGTTKNIYQNEIRDLHGTTLSNGSVNGISVSGSTTVNIYKNTISSLSANSLTSGSINGIIISGGTTVSVYRNKIYDLSCSSSSMTGTINGIIVSGSTVSLVSNINNNIIGDLRVTAASGGDLIRGISLISTGTTSSHNIYYNTIYINASSTGTNFGTTGVYHTASTTSTTATLDLRNNIINNISTPKGSGLVVALRRSGTSFGNYSSASNRNLLYAGAPGTTRLILSNTASYQTLLDYQTIVGSGIDGNSVTEDLVTGNNFLSTIGTDPNFLHLNSGIASLAASGGLPIVGYSLDYDEETRNATNTDIGADEFSGSRAQPISGTYNVGVGEIFTSLTNASGLFAEINSVGLNGNLVINITTNIAETGSNSLYQWREAGSGGYTITIKPSAASTRELTGSSVSGFIRFIGADRVLIDGSYAGSGQYLTFRNTSTGVTSTFQFTSDARKNTVKNCIIQGSGTSATSGTILFSTGSAAGNDSNSISNNSIMAAGSNLPTNALYSAGTSTVIDNSGTVISNNTFQDYFNTSLASNGILIASNSSAWTISGNKFFQTATRTATANKTNRAIKILTAAGIGYTVSNNIIGYANSSSTGLTTYNGNFANIFLAIELTVGTSVPSNVQGNTIAGIGLSTTSAASVPGIFSGISILGGAVNIGTTTPNIIGASTGNGSLSVTSTTTAGVITGIYANSAGTVSIQNNSIGSFSNGGGSAIGYTVYGIYTAGTGGNRTISSNIIGSASTSNSIAVGTDIMTTTGICTFGGIRNTATGTISITSNTIQNCTTFGTGNSAFYGIYNSGGSGTLNITGNSILNCTNTGSSSSGTAGPFICIWNSAVVTTANISTNIIRNHLRSLTTGLFTGITNTGAVTGAININSNQLGNGTGGMVTYNLANSSAFTGINNSGGTATCALSIQSNDFRGIAHLASSTNAHTFIINSATTLSQNISSNTFTNLDINSSGTISFISNNVSLSATGTQDINSNSIVTGFTRSIGSGSGSLTIFNTAGSSVSGSVINNNNNSFSNITVNGTSTITGWTNTDAGNGSKKIQGNTFSNWTAGTGTITVINVNTNGTNNSTKNNTISHITSSGPITGITTGTGNDSINLNTIHTFNSNIGSVIGINISSGTDKWIYRNKIYNLQTADPSSGVNGILVSSTAPAAGGRVSIINNIIGSLLSPSGSGITDAVRGISLLSTTTTSVINVYFNTIYLNATSTGSDFNTSGVYQVADTVSTTAALDLRNNIIINNSTPRGTGLTVAFRRSDGGVKRLLNYSSSSNNNLYYAGSPDAAHLIYYDGVSGPQTISNFKSSVFPSGTISPRDSSSVTDDFISVSKFLSTTGSSSGFLHIDVSKLTNAESGGRNISGITSDFDGEIRQGNSGYSGGGEFPDIGADEINGCNKGVWNGSTDTNWNNTANWNCGGIPDAAFNTIIPSGLTNYPVINAGISLVKNIILQTGTSLTVRGVLKIAGIITNNSSINASHGSIEMIGNVSQTIPSGCFTGNVVKNITINNSAGVILSDTLGITGILKVNSGDFITGNYLTLKSSSLQTALIDGSGNGEVLGTVTMQRYLSRAFGYKYLSSPFTGASVFELSDDINLNAAFPTFYRYDENQSSTGWVSYTNISSILNPLEGYSANFGTTTTPKTFDIRGVVNNGPLSINLYNNNQPTTLGFNLIGNPYPSPIDWDASLGISRTNIDDAVYYFDAGNTDEYLGSYSSYINGISSNDTATNIIASMQGFFVHVSNGTFPVNGNLSINNSARINNLNVKLHKKSKSTNYPLVRLHTYFAQNDLQHDATVIYLDSLGTHLFDKKSDALKIMNTDIATPNIYSFAADSKRLSINSIPIIKDTLKIIPLGINVKKGGKLIIQAKDIMKIPRDLFVYLHDSKAGIYQNLKLNPLYSLTVNTGTIENRISLVFSSQELKSSSGTMDDFIISSHNGKLYVTKLAESSMSGDIYIRNMQGQTICKEKFNGLENKEIGPRLSSGVYIISFESAERFSSKKIFIPNN